MCWLKNPEGNLSFPTAYKLFQRNRAALLFINVEISKLNSFLKKSTRLRVIFQICDKFIPWRFPHVQSMSEFTFSPQPPPYLPKNPVIKFRQLKLYQTFYVCFNQTELSTPLKIKHVIIQLCCLPFNFTL